MLIHSNLLVDHQVRGKSIIVGMMSFSIVGDLGCECSLCRMYWRLLLVRLVRRQLRRPRILRGLLGI